MRVVGAAGAGQGRRARRVRVGRLEGCCCRLALSALGCNWVTGRCSPSRLHCLAADHTAHVHVKARTTPTTPRPSACPVLTLPAIQDARERTLSLARPI